jgi:hypothetical protein
MRGFSPRIRFGFVILSVALLIAIYLSVGERPNSAQQRPVGPPPTAKFEQFAKSD